LVPFSVIHFFYKEGDNTIELNISTHNLALGSYYMNISISSGTVQKDNLRMLDHAYQSITFEISREKEETVHLTQWNSNWGKLSLQSKVKLTND